MVKTKDRYFYLEGKLHKVLHINRAQDIATCWSFPDRKRIAYIWSDVQKKRQFAFSIGQLAKMLNRHPDRVKRAMKSGAIETPQQAYSLDGQYLPMSYYWSEDDAIDVHKYFSSLHIGRPRKDGRKTNNSLPSPYEFRTRLRYGRMLYTEEDGHMVPVFMHEE